MAWAWSHHRGRRLSAALAYYSAFAAASSFVIVTALAGLLIGRGTLQEEIAARSGEALGSSGAAFLRWALAGIGTPRSSLAAVGISVVTLLYGALRVFVQLEDALNAIWEVESQLQRGLVDRVRSHLNAFGIVLLGGFLALASVMSQAASATISRLLGIHLADYAALWHAGDLVLSFGLLTLVFALLYRHLPSVKIAFGDVLPGAVLSALLFFLARHMLGIYLTYGAFASVYGAAGSFLVLLLFFYYSAQILLLGAEVTHIYAIRHGSHAKLAAALVSESPT